MFKKELHFQNDFQGKQNIPCNGRLVIQINHIIIIYTLSMPWNWRRHGPCTWCRYFIWEISSPDQLKGKAPEKSDDTQFIYLGEPKKQILYRPYEKNSSRLPCHTLLLWQPVNVQSISHDIKNFQKKCKNVRYLCAKYRHLSDMVFCILVT